MSDGAWVGIASCVILIMQFVVVAIVRESRSFAQKTTSESEARLSGAIHKLSIQITMNDAGLRDHTIQIAKIEQKMDDNREDEDKKIDKNHDYQNQERHRLIQIVQGNSLRIEALSTKFEYLEKSVEKLPYK